MHTLTTSIKSAAFAAALFLAGSITSVAYADVAPNPWPPEEAPFSDVDENNEALTLAVRYLKMNNAVGGYSDGTFRPDALINRAEFAKIILLMHTTMSVSTPIEETPKLPFTDLAEGAWYKPYVRVAYENSVLAGYPDGTFRPDDNINFAEAAKIVVRAYRLEYDESATGAWYQPYWDTLRWRENDTNMIPTSVKSPEQKITRGEMAQLLYNIAIYKRHYSRIYLIR